jgi:hypothetical protein
LEKFFVYEIEKFYSENSFVKKNDQRLLETASPNIKFRSSPRSPRVLVILEWWKNSQTYNKGQRLKSAQRQFTDSDDTRCKFTVVLPWGLNTALTFTSNQGADAQVCPSRGLAQALVSPSLLKGVW